MASQVNRPNLSLSNNFSRFEAILSVFFFVFFHITVIFGSLVRVRVSTDTPLLRTFLQSSKNFKNYLKILMTF